MKKVLYTKYNRARKPEFQIGTKIIETDGKKYVSKFALRDEAIQQIDSLEIESKKLQDVFYNIRFDEGKRVSKSEIQFQYLEFTTLGDKIRDITDLESCIEKLFDVRPEYIVPFAETVEFNKVFGHADKLKGVDALSISNIDMIFDNLFIDTENDKYICIDNEWVFNFPVPVEFVKYRMLHYLYTKNVLKIPADYKEYDFLKKFGIAHINCMEKMEENFQAYTIGDNSRYTDKYIQKKVSLNELIEQNKSSLEQKRQTEEQNKMLTDKNHELIGQNRGAVEIERVFEACKYENKKLNESIKDKDVHIRNLEAMLKIQAQEKDTHIRNLEAMLYNAKHPVKVFYREKKHAFGKKVRKILTLKGYGKLELPNEEKPLVSIIIPVYNEFDYTYKCVQSIINNVKGVSYEVIIGDDESTDATRKISKVIKNIRVNVNESDHGFLMNCNCAAKLARGKYIVFLNNDTLVQENWLESLVTLIESSNEIGLVGSKLIYPDGKLQEAGGIIWSDGTGWNYGRNQDAGMPEYNYVRECDYISGASILISKELWNEIGGFDERFKPAYCEDSDLAFEVRKRGYKVMYQPKSVVIHFEGVSNGTDLDAGLKKYQVENNKKFKEKWHDELHNQFKDPQSLFCARERNHDKKVILYVDHYVPTYDKDAGSKTTFEYIKMFLSKGYIIKFLGDNFAQMEPYTSVLEQMGVEVLYGPWYSDHIYEWIENNKEHIDFAYLNRPHISVKYIDFLNEKTDIKIIYYGHDLHFLRTAREAETTGNMELMGDSEAWKYKELSVMKKASVSYYPSEVEEKAIHEIDPSVHVKAITAYVFDKFIENYSYNAKNRDGILFVGGFSHHPNIDGVKWFVENVYNIIRDKQNIPFYIVGSNAPDEIKALDGNGIVFKGFVSDEELSDIYKKCKMVVVPLRYGAGVKGKVIEAIYNGIPIVTTSVGAEGIKNVEDVVCVEDEPKQFAEKVLELYNDDEQLESMGNKSQQFVKEYFSIDAVWKIIEEDFT